MVVGAVLSWVYVSQVDALPIDTGNWATQPEQWVTLDDIYRELSGKVLKPNPATSWMNIDQLYDYYNK